MVGMAAARMARGTTRISSTLAVLLLSSSLLSSSASFQSETLESNAPAESLSSETQSPSSTHQAKSCIAASRSSLQSNCQNLGCRRCHGPHDLSNPNNPLPLIVDGTRFYLRALKTAANVSNPLYGIVG